MITRLSFSVDHGPARLSWGLSADKSSKTIQVSGVPGYAIAVSPDGERFASAGKDCNVRLWDGKSGQLLFTLYGHQHFVWGVAFSPDGRRLAGTSSNVISVWDAPVEPE